MAKGILIGLSYQVVGLSYHGSRIVIFRCGCHDVTALQPNKFSFLKPMIEMKIFV